MIILQVEEPKRLLSWSRHNLLNNRQTGWAGTNAQKRALLPIEGKLQSEALFYAATNPVVSVERPWCIETVLLRP